MSHRTREADKAIRKAWKRELELVKDGKGTREWTKEQQRDILETGKVHDENGIAFQGHHMISVESRPEFQGCPENIQFLSADEHKKAHHGDFHNPTNGYYDPFTDTTRVFTGDTYEPCEIIELLEPVNDIVKVLPVEKTVVSESSKVDEETGPPQEDEALSAENDESSEFRATLEEIDREMDRLRAKINERPNVESRPIQYVSRPIKPKGFIARCKFYLGKAGRFVKNNPELVMQAVKTGIEIHNAVQGVKQFNQEVQYERAVQESVRRVAETPLPQSSSSLPDNPDPVPITEPDKVKRASPIEHTVKPSGQHYGKNKVWKEKKAYQRGGKKSNE